MKSLLRGLGILCLIVALLTFMYSSIKIYKAEEGIAGEIEVSEEITAVLEDSEMEAATSALSVAGVFVLLGGGLIFFSTQSGKQVVRSRR